MSELAPGTALARLIESLGSEPADLLRWQVTPPRVLRQDWSVSFEAAFGPEFETALRQTGQAIEAVGRCLAARPSGLLVPPVFESAETCAEAVEPPLTLERLRETFQQFVPVPMRLQPPEPPPDLWHARFSLLPPVRPLEEPTPDISLFRGWVTFGLVPSLSAAARERLEVALAEAELTLEYRAWRREQGLDEWPRTVVYGPTGGIWAAAAGLLGVEEVGADGL